MRYTEIINEMPVAGIEKILKPASQKRDMNRRFRDQDEKYMSGKNYDEIVKKKLRYVPFDLYIYIVDTEQTRKIPYISAYDRPLEQFYSTFIPLSDNHQDFSLSNLQIDSIQKNYNENPKAVHLLISHNDPEANDWMPLTPWMILHRLGHACLDADQKAYQRLPIVKTIRNSWYNMVTSRAETMALVKKHLKTKSAKASDSDELLIEMFVSHCVNGNIAFRYEKEDWGKLHRVQHVFDELFTELIEELRGKVWIG